MQPVGSLEIPILARAPGLIIQLKSLTFSRYSEMMTSREQQLSVTFLFFRLGNRDKYSVDAAC